MIPTPTFRLARLLLAVLLAAAICGPGAVTGAGVRPAAAFSGAEVCTQQGLLHAIQRRFVHTDRNVLKRGLRIEDISRAHENRRRPKAELRPVGRIYCHATAHMSDGRKRQLWYLIESGWGFAGIGDNVEFCIDGLDPWKVHGAWCRSVR